MRQHLNETLARHEFGPFDFNKPDEPALFQALVHVARKYYPDLSNSKIEETTKVAIQNKFWDDLRGYHDEQMIERRNQRVRVYCLSERNDDICMWAYYADAHRGVCLQFQVAPDTPFGNAKSVEYVKEYPRINRFSSIAEDQYRATLLTKSYHWAHEKERRIIRLDNNHYLKFPEHLLSGIILGCSITEDGKQKVIDWLKYKKHKVNLYQAMKKKWEFGLDISPIT